MGRYVSHGLHSEEFGTEFFGRLRLRLRLRAHGVRGKAINHIAYGRSNYAELAEL